jgi:voltage-gated potassium channel
VTNGVTSSKPQPLVVRRRHRFRETLLYVLAILKEFRWTLLALAALIVWGTVLYAITPHIQFGGERPDLLTAFYGAWMALLAQSITPVPEPWHLMLMHAVYPVFGFVLIGEGVVRLALLLMSKRLGEKEWMRVMAQTHRNHIVLCGLGHLGYRVFENLVASHVDVVVIEINPDNRFMAQAKATGACILIRDMKDDQALVDAGVEQARAIVIATNDDIANLEVAMDARRMNPGIHILLRLFDQRIAQKISGALTIDVAFSASALAAPIVAAMSMDTKVLSTMMIGGVPHVISELRVEPASPLAGRRIDQIELGYAARVLALTPKDGTIQSPPTPATPAAAGDVLVVHTAASQLATISAAGRAGTSS